MRFPSQRTPADVCADIATITQSMADLDPASDTYAAQYERRDGYLSELWAMRAELTA